MAGKSTQAADDVVAGIGLIREVAIRAYDEFAGGTRG